MSCFSCCEEEEHLKAAESRRPYVVKSSTGNDGNYHASDGARQSAQTVKVQPIEVPTISANELKEITDNFVTNSLIGEGSYGRIYYGVLKNGVAAAIKKLDASKEPDNEFLAQFSMVSRLKHENFVQLLGYCVDGSSHVLAYEFASNGSLHNILHGRKGVKGTQPSPVLSWTQSVKVTVGAAKGLEYLHEKANPDIIHRDIKSSNVLIFDDDVAKIADFDLSNQAPEMAACFHYCLIWIEIEELRRKLQGSHAEVLEQEILKLRNDPLKYELECEKLEMELEEKRKLRDQWIKEQKMKIRSFSGVVSLSNCERNRSQTGQNSLRQSHKEEHNELNSTSQGDIFQQCFCLKAPSNVFVAMRSTYLAIPEYSPLPDAFSNVVDENTWLKLNKGYVADLDSLQATSIEIQCHNYFNQFVIFLSKLSVEHYMSNIADITAA
ncbi:hypothetical protein K1719_008895 [Acacia pycnantha]|nr:hypothetical protein K1719_008895 [Acacia pycnantha]